MQSPRRVAILGGNRIPFARSNGAYATASNQAMLTATLEGLVERYRLHGLRLGEVVAGAVLKHSRDLSLTRECVLGLRRVLLEANRGRRLSERLKPFLKLRPSFLKPEFPRNGEPRTGLSMGEHCERMAQTWQIERAEQDALALLSHQHLAEAYDQGWHDDLLTPYLGLTRDNNLRPDLTAEQLAKLKPVFDKGPKGTLTAGNSTPLTDGASLVLLGSEAWAEQQGLSVLAYLVDGEAAAVDFVKGREGLLMAPVHAVPRLLARNGLSLQDFDYYEIHEAFAAQVLCTLKAWEDERYCREVLGLDANMAKLLAKAGKGRGLISICAASGQGVTAIVER